MKRLVLRITDKCNATCKHCLYSDSPSGKLIMSELDIENYINKCKPSQCVIFSGGEASLYFKRVIHGIKYAKNLNISTWLNTNAYWGRDKVFSDFFSSELKKAGLDRVNVSIDAFHQEFINFDYTVNSIKSLIKAKIPKIKIFMTSFSDSKYYDDLNNEYYEKLKKIEGISFDIRSNTYIGRAIEKLGEYATPKPIDIVINEECSLEDSEGNLIPFSEFNYYTINPDGSVELCSDISLSGNLKYDDFNYIVSNENTLNNELVKTLKNKGVSGLLELGLINGYPKLDSYISKCQLCFDLRKYLNLNDNLLI